MAEPIGVLALQGDFSLHVKALRRLRVPTLIVRKPKELFQCTALILPGGESSTFIKLLKKTGLFSAIQEFAQDHTIMGTCAGLIALSTKIINDSMQTLGLIDLEVERNAYGRQVDSFQDKIEIPMFQDKPDFEGIFIRAPRIKSLGSDCEALGFHHNEVVMARNQKILVTTFHPELTLDTRIHNLFMSM